jgi:hypothetical protein
MIPVAGYSSSSVIVAIIDNSVGSSVHVTTGATRHGASNRTNSIDFTTG